MNTVTESAVSFLKVFKHETESIIVFSTELPREK